MVWVACRPHQQELRAWAENLVLGRPQSEESDRKVIHLFLALPSHQPQQTKMANDKR